MKVFSTFVLLVLIMGFASLRGQEPEASDEATPITGGVVYEPVKGEDDKLRDPFKSPFELEQEERERAERDRAVNADLERRLPYNINELELKGIYLQAVTGYWAIFKIGEDYKWWQVGEKFRDGNLVNIADGAVVFKNIVADDPTQVREIVKELRRGEE